jgi:hypothetical protein
MHTNLTAIAHITQAISGDADGDVIAPQDEGQPWAKGTRRVYVD